jgi:hypothetical protein
MSDAESVDSFDNCCNPPDSDDERFMAQEELTQKQQQQEMEIVEEMTQQLPPEQKQKKQRVDKEPSERKKKQLEQEQRMQKMRARMEPDSPPNSPRIMYNSPHLRGHNRSSSMPRMALSRESSPVRRPRSARPDDDDVRPSQPQQQQQRQLASPFDIPEDLPRWQAHNAPDDIVRQYCHLQPETGSWPDVLALISTPRDAQREDFIKFYQRQCQALRAMHACDADSAQPERALCHIEKIARLLHWVSGGDVHADNGLKMLEIANRLIGPAGEQSPNEVHMPCMLLKQYAAGIIGELDLLRSSAAAVRCDLNENRLADVRDKLTKFYCRVDAVERMRSAMCDMYMYTAPSFQYMFAESVGVFTDEDVQFVKDSFQRALLTVMREARRRNLRRIGTTLYEPHYLYSEQSGKRTPTHFYQPHGSVGEFLGEICDYQVSQAYETVMIAQNLKNIPNWIEVCNTTDLPVLVRDRHAFSFRNGLFSGLDSRSPPRHRFYPYTSPAIAQCAAISVNFIDQDLQPEWCSLPYNFFPGDATCRHDCDIPAEFCDDDWMFAIPTPSLDRLFLWQWPEEPEQQQQLNSALRTIDPKILRRFTYAMLGRLMYDVGECDRWAIMLMIIGHAQTGKSLLADKLYGQSVYQRTDVHATSTNSETTFGLAPMYDKLLWYIPEVRRRDNRGPSGLSQSDFLLMVEGGNVEIRKKYKIAMNVLWTVPGFGVGNEFNEWQDKKDSLTRRLFLAHFNRPVPASERDDDLVDGLTRTELGAVIVKCVHAYLSLLEYMRTRRISSLQTILPEQVLICLFISSSLLA